MTIHATGLMALPKDAVVPPSLIALCNVGDTTEQGGKWNKTYPTFVDTQFWPSITEA